MGYEIETLIDDGELIKGASSPITLFYTDMADDLSGGDWICRYTIISDFGEIPIVERALSLNSEVLDGIPINGCFVHQIVPSESLLLTENTKYIVTVEISNASINYNDEVAQFKVKIKPQGVV